MKKVYVQTKNGLAINADIQNAIDGFEYLGYEVKCISLEEIMSGMRDFAARNSPFVCSIDGMRKILSNIGKTPDPIDFPNEIVNVNLVGRVILKMPLNKAMAKFKTNGEPLFVKPVATKLFDGILLTKEEDLNYFSALSINPEVYVSEKIDILSEYRIYVHHGKMIHSCCYEGDFRLTPDYSYIDKMISVYKSAPVAYTIDVAILDDGRNVLMECNDFWAIGSYGLKSWDYAQMLADRYEEIIK